jgi:hypothetical protein
VVAYIDADLRSAGVQAIAVSHEKFDLVSTILDGLRRPCTHESSAPRDQNLHQTLQYENPGAKIRRETS